MKNLVIKLVLGCALAVGAWTACSSGATSGDCEALCTGINVCASGTATNCALACAGVDTLNGASGCTAAYQAAAACAGSLTDTVCIDTTGCAAASQAYRSCISTFCDANRTQCGVTFTSGSSSTSTSSGSSAPPGCTINANGTSVCIEYSGLSAAQVATAQSACASNGGTWGTCSMSNVLGTCNMTAGTAVYYSGGGITAAQAQAGCTSAGGTWSGG